VGEGDAHGNAELAGAAHRLAVEPQSRQLAAVDDLDVERFKSIEAERLDGRLLGRIASGQVLDRAGLLLGVGDLALMEELVTKLWIALQPLAQILRVHEIDPNQRGVQLHAPKRPRRSACTSSTVCRVFVLCCRKIRQEGEMEG
jgi:hypothetical protein